MTGQPIAVVAREIRAELPVLLEAEDAVRVERHLGVLLERADAGEDVDDEMVALLAATEPTRVRLDDLLAEELARGERSFEPLPGRSPEPPGVQTYCCPHGDYEWPVFEAGEAIPDCPVHNTALVPSEAVD